MSKIQDSAGTLWIARFALVMGTVMIAFAVLAITITSVNFWSSAGIGFIVVGILGWGYAAYLYYDNRRFKEYQAQQEQEDRERERQLQGQVSQH